MPTFVRKIPQPLASKKLRVRPADRSRFGLAQLPAETYEAGLPFRTASAIGMRRPLIWRKRHARDPLEVYGELGTAH